MQIVAHVVALHLHIIAHLVEAGGADHMTFAIDLPGDGCVLGTHLVAARLSGGGSGVDVDIFAHILVNDHATNHVWVEVGLVVDDGEHLAVHAYSARDVLRAERQEGLEGEVAEDSIVEGCLILVDGAACTSGGVGPVHLVGFSDHHALAVLPVVGSGELGIVGVVVLAAKAVLHLVLIFSARRREIAIGPLGSRNVAVRTIARLVVLADGVVLRSQMPVHVDGAHRALPVRLGVGHEVAYVEVAHVSLRDVRPRLGSGYLQLDTKLVLEGELRSSAGVVHLGGREEFGRGLAREEVDADGEIGRIARRVLVTCGKSKGSSEQHDGGQTEGADGILVLGLENRFLFVGGEGFGRRAHGSNGR